MNGDIRGSIEGGWDDYSIHCSIKKGDSDLPSAKDGGDVHIDFVIRQPDA